MLTRTNPKTLRPVPSTFAGIYTHSTQLETPSRLVAMSGQIGVAMDGSVPPGFADQCAIAMDHVEALLQANTLHLSDILRLTYYLTRSSDLAELTRLRQERWHTSTPPAITTLVVAGLATPELLVEIEVLAGI